MNILWYVKILWRHVMGKEKDVLKSLSDGSVSRRSFLKGLAAVSALGVAAGCSKNDDPEVIYGGGIR